MRQARALMDKYRIEEGDVLASEVAEASARSGSKSRPVYWESSLSGVVGKVQ